MKGKTQMARDVHPNRRRGPVDLRPDDVTIIMGWRGELTDGLFCPPLSKPYFTHNAELIYQFSGPEERLTWTVRAPKDDNYKVSILCSGDNDILDDCEVELQSNGVALTMAVGKRQEGEDTMIRRTLDGVLPLKKGTNHISFRLPHGTWRSGSPVVPDGDPSKLTYGQRIGFGLRSIEVVTEKDQSALCQRAESIRADASWMVEGKYGVFIHWSPLCYSLYGNRRRMEFHEESVNMFDAEAFADGIAETGAAWVCLTTSHGPQYWPGPSETIDRILPGRTAKRDLIAEIAAALKKRSIRLMLYYHFSVHGETDVAWAEAAGAYEADPTTWFGNVESLFRETSLRYGTDIEGFGYIDDVGSIVYRYDPPWEQWARAIKAGNPNALVGLSVQGGPNVSPFNELQVDDPGSHLRPVTPDSAMGPGSYFGDVIQARWFVLDAWSPSEPLNGVIGSGPVHPTEDYVRYFSEMADAGVPLTVNLLITADVTRKQPFFNPKSVEVMKAIRKAIRG
jgi:hypothetical protein